MTARYILVILGLLLVLQHGVVSSSHRLTGESVVLSGIVITVQESRVGDVKVELTGNGNTKAIETDPYGTFRFEVSPGRYSLSAASPGFCPLKRPEFELKPAASAALVLTIIPCPAGNVMRYDKDGRYAGEERRYLTNFKNDVIGVTNSAGVSFDLLIRYAEKRALSNTTKYEGGDLSYSETDPSSVKGVATRTVRLGVEVNYNLWTINADSVTYNSRKATVSATGNVVVTHPEQSFKAKSILLDLRNETLLSAIDRSSIARRETLNKSATGAESRILLGEKLYFDKRLSADGTVSCASCHDPASAFASKDTVAVGVGQRSGTRNVPTLLNAKFGESFFWDGRARTLEEQAKQPLLNAVEMALESEAALIARLSAIPEYQKAFRRVFPREGITLETVARAIAAYERTLISDNSPFDRFIKGDEKALTPGQKAGWALFKGKAKCIECHTFSAASLHFTDAKFYNTGVAGRDQDFKVLSQRADELRARQQREPIPSGLLAHQPEFSELGRFLVTKANKDIGAFKTPSLRDVELTGPYMHNGSLRTLLDVVRFYNQGGHKNPNLDSKMHALELNETEMSEIVEFLRALTSDDVLRRAQSSKPQTRVAITLLP